MIYVYNIVDAKYDVKVRFYRTMKIMFADVNLMLANCFNKAKINEDCLTNRKDPTRKISLLN